MDNKAAYIFLSFIFFIYVQLSVAQLPDSFYFNTTSDEQVHFQNNAIYFITINGRLLKSNYSGNIIWSRLIGNPISLTTDEQSIYYINGSRILVKMDTSGNTIWAKSIRSPFCGLDSTWVSGIVTTNNKIFLHPTYTIGTKLVMLDSSGNVLNTLCGGNGSPDNVVNAYPTLQGGNWLQYVLSPGNVSQAAIVRIDPSGVVDTTAPTVVYDIAYYELLKDIIPMADSSYLVVDNGDDWLINRQNFGIFKISESGNVIWNKVFGWLFSAPDTSFNVVRAGTDSSNNIYLIISVLENQTFYFVSLKFDAGGNLLFSKKWISYPPDLYLYETYSRMHFHNNHFYCPVEGINTMNFFVFDTLMNACHISNSTFTISEISYTINQIPWYAGFPASFSPVNTILNINAGTNPASLNYCNLLNLESNSPDTNIFIFPNPINDRLTISLIKPADFSIKIFDIHGVAVYFQLSPHQSTDIDLSFLSPGIYFIHLDSNGKVITKKLIKLNPAN